MQHVTKQPRDEYVASLQHEATLANENNKLLRAAFSAADKYIDRLRERLRGDAAPDLDECQRMFAHHKLQLHSKPIAR